jgi:hypothetical protein
VLTRRFVALSGLAGVLALVPRPVGAARTDPVFVYVAASVPVRVQIALSPGLTTPCDSAENTVVFDDWVDPQVGVAVQVETGPLCVNHTYDDFPGVNWARSQLWTRRSRRDPGPLRIYLDARAEHAPP